MKEKAGMAQYADIIRRARTARGLSQEELAVRVGVSRNAVAGWETGHSRPDLATVPVLCSALRISLARFFGHEKPRTEQEREVLELFSRLDENDRQAFLWQMQALVQGRARQREREQAPRRLIRLYRSDLGVAAGFGAALDEAAGEEIWLVRDRETERADEVITVSGRSMEPDFYDGEQVLVQHTERVLPGEVGVFLVDNEGFIKEYQADGLHSRNPEYPVMTFEAGQHVRCVGRVVGKLREDQRPTENELKNMQAETAGRKAER